MQELFQAGANMCMGDRSSRARGSNHKWESLAKTSIGRKASALRERGLIKDIAELSVEKPAPGAVNSCNAFRCSRSE